MTRAELLRVHKVFTKRAFEVLKKRNTEYAAPERALENFEKQASFLNTQPEEVILFYVKENMDRLHNMYQKGILHKRESQVEDKSIDLINYGVLLYAAVLQRRQTGASNGTVAKRISHHHSGARRAGSHIVASRPKKTARRK